MSSRNADGLAQRVRRLPTNRLQMIIKLKLKKAPTGMLVKFK